MLEKLLYFSIIFTIGEILFNLTLFKWLKKKFTPEEIKGTNDSKILSIEITTLKGIIERFAIFLSLTVQIPQILIAFGAFKIGTRLQPDNQQKVANDYFLIGNFVSIIISVVYYRLYIHLAC